MPIFLVYRIQFCKMEEVKIIGGGLAGSEAAWQIANAGIKVRLYEMRPKKSTGAHKTSHLAEIICSNSLGSELIDRPSGLLAAELDILKLLLINIAKSCKVPAGHALAIDRDIFSKSVTEKLATHPNITIIREEVTNIPSGITIVASGPLTSEGLASAILQKTGKENLFFYDAIAPIIETSSINMDIAFNASRYGRSSDPKGDYINCPFTKPEYDRFIEELVNAETVELSELEHNIKIGGKGR